MPDLTSDGMEKVLDRMRSLCSRREYCRSDIMKKAMKALDGDRVAAEKVVEADNFSSASAYLAKEMRAADVILYENDLPDSFK